MGVIEYLLVSGSGDEADFGGGGAERGELRRLGEAEDGVLHYIHGCHFCVRYLLLLLRTLSLSLL